MSPHPLKLHTQKRGRETLLLVALGAMVLLNLVWAMSFRAMAANFNKPRIVMNTREGLILPLASSVFTWNPSTGESFIKNFLPQCYTFSPMGLPPKGLFIPFINPALLDASQQRFERDKGVIESEGIMQTLFVQSVRFDSSFETAAVTAELRRINRRGEISRTPMTLTVEMITTADPLNPYGHRIQVLH